MGMPRPLYNKDRDVKRHGRGTIKCMPRPLFLPKLLTIFDFNHTQNLYLKIHVPIFFDLQTLNLNVPQTGIETTSSLKLAEL